uniref:histidine kinase n=1 Tax=Ettlia oleoabundans TaxID=1127754 RepID=A0A126WXZ3_9CHLO|nr:putative LOV domain-containing protein [Ettlia oleoabundans]
MTVIEQAQEVLSCEGGEALLPTLPGNSSQHDVLSAIAGAGNMLGYSQGTLHGSDPQQVLCHEVDQQAAAACTGLGRRLAGEQEGCTQLQLHPQDGPSGDGGCSSGDTGQCLDVTVTPLLGGRCTWACQSSYGPHASVADEQQQLDPAQPWQPPEVEGAAALHVLPQPIWVCDAAGRVVFANPALCQVAACLDETSAIGRLWTQLLQPAEGSSLAAEQLGAAIAAGQRAQVDMWCGSSSISGSHSSNNNGRFHCRINVAPLASRNGDSGARSSLIVCTLLNAQLGPNPGAGPGAVHVPAAGLGLSTVSPADGAADTSTCTAADDAVPPPLAQLCNQALASTSESIVITDPTQPGQPIIYANKAFERLTGYSQSSVLGRGHSFLHGPDTDPVVLADIAAALEEGRPIAAELLVYRADGTPFWSQISITPIRESGSSGRVANYVMVQRDVSQRKAAEAAFHMREQALSNLNEGITICDPSVKDCPVVYCNTAFLRITGYSRKEVIGRNCRFLQGPRTDPATVQRLATALHEGREVTVELLNYRKNGEEFYNMLSITPVRDAAGRLLSFIGVQSDVTELTLRRQAEKELQEAKAAAETAAEAKSMFLANMSHEIRTPLNGMIAVAQMLLASGLSPEQRELADMILESGNTLLTILGDILDFSKIDHNSMVLESAPLALRDTLEASIEMVAADAARKGLEVAYRLAPPLVRRRLLGDSIRIRQVLSNLLSNAVKFTAEGEVVVDAWVDEEGLTAGAAAQPPDKREPITAAAALNGAPSPAAASSLPAASQGPLLHMTVRDSGIGISQEGIARLFQCFRQGHESMSRRYGGTGLGLAISRRLAELMGGNVWVESLEGQGSTFHFTMALQWEGEVGSGAGLDKVAAYKAAGFGSIYGEDSAPVSRRASASSERPMCCSLSSTDSPLAAAAAAAVAAVAANGPASTAAAASNGDSCGASTGGGHRAEEQRLLLQQHHEALLQQLLQSSVAPTEGSLASASAQCELAAGGGSVRLSESTDSPNTPLIEPPARQAASSVSMSVSAVSSTTVLASLAGSYSALPAFGGMGSGTPAAPPRSEATHPSNASRGNSSSRRSSAETVPAAGRRESGDSVSSGRRSRDSGDISRPPRPPPPAYDYRLSSFYAPSQGSVKAQSTAPGPAQVDQPAVSPSSARAAAALGPGAGAACSQPQPSGHSQSGSQMAKATVPGKAASATGAESRRRSADCSASCSSAPPASGAAQPAAPEPQAVCHASVLAPGGPTDLPIKCSGGGGVEAAPLRGRHVRIDVAHLPTAQQVAQSCGLLGMEVELRRCSSPPSLPPKQDPGCGTGCTGSDPAPGPSSPRDFCITTPDKALEAVRAGWRGQPLVVLGRREELPLNLQAMATTVSKPVKHMRLVGALLKAAAFARSKQQTPLHTDPQMLSLLPERLLLNRLATNRRMSLDNSALDRRRWQMMAAAAAATAAAGGVEADNDAPVALRSSAPTAGGSNGGGQRQAGGGPPQSLQLEAGIRPRVDSAAEGCWRPQLPAIPSHSSRGSSARSSFDVPDAHAVATPHFLAAASVDPARLQQAAAAALSAPHAPVPMPLPSVAIQPAAMATPNAAADSTTPAATHRAPRILVAEDNLINQRVISKVLQRVVPDAEVTIVGNGVLAVRAATSSPYDLCLMDIHMPEMDGLEASRCLQQQLPPEQRPVVVALSADTLQVLHEKCRDAGIQEFICKPFRMEDVERVLALVQPRLQHQPVWGPALTHQSAS